MPHGDKNAPKTRAETDASLRTERDRTDEELARRRRAVEEETDATLDHAREREDRGLGEERRQEDERISPTARVRADRSRADADLVRSRGKMDAVLQDERVRRQIAVGRLLLAERQQTDSRLLVERTRADDDLTRRDEFLAMLSHDMRSLLGTIALSATVLEGQQHTPSAVARCTSSIQRATAQMSRLVADLLDVASLDAGKFILVRGLHDAGRIVREAADAFAPTAHENQLALAVDVPGDQLMADCDPDRIAQVLANLLGNAVKFTRPNGTIGMGVALREGEICFHVSDTGQGIPAEKLETIFDRYSQLGGPDRPGRGLGLYISQHIIAAHGGRIWAESIVGQGSTFHFTVPRSA